MSLSRLLVLLLAGLFSGLMYAETQRPNILVIVSDDQGYSDFGFTGNPVVQTPALDALAKESAFYPHFVVGPACTPTRVSLYTGRHYLDTGVWGVGSRGRVRRDEVLMPRFFTPSGYQTWAVGKMDGGLYMMEIGPLDRGFDWFCVATGRSYIQRDPVIEAPGVYEPSVGWSVELLTDRAIDKIRTDGDRPWMLHMNYIIPHLPWECPDAYADLFRDQGYSEDLAQCYGSIKQMDDQIARLLNALEELGHAENTIVLFMSDNGPLDAKANVETSVWRNMRNPPVHSEDWQYRSPNGLVGRKGEVWDHGIRSPLLVRWPAEIQPGVRKHVIGVEDVLPTLLELCQIPKASQPEHFPFSGTSFSGSLKDQAYSDDRDIFRLATGGPGVPMGDGMNNPDPKTLSYGRLHTILRSGKYKFHHLPRGKLRLYDMENDPTESKDLSALYPELTESMAARCRAQWDGIAARNRTFQMRQLRINNADAPRQQWGIAVLQPLRLEGKMHMHEWLGGVNGFRLPGDRAEYSIEVQQSLSVAIVVKGKGFDQCAPIHLLVDGKPAKVLSRSQTEIKFQAMALSEGARSITLMVPSSEPAGQATGEVTEIVLTKV